MSVLFPFQKAIRFIRPDPVGAGTRRASVAYLYGRPTMTHRHDFPLLHPRRTPSFARVLHPVPRAPNQPDPICGVTHSLTRRTDGRTDGRSSPGSESESESESENPRRSSRSPRSPTYVFIDARRDSNRVFTRLKHARTRSIDRGGPNPNTFFVYLCVNSIIPRRFHASGEQQRQSG